MASFSGIIKRNRKYFGRQAVSLSDQKSIDLSERNINLIEIIDFMIWSATRGKSGNEA